MLASELINDIRDAGDFTPDVDDSTLLRAADAEIRTRLLPMLHTVNEEFLVRSIDITAVNGRVPLPPRAVAAGIRLVQLVSGAQLYTLPRLDPGRDTGNGVNSGQPYGFYFDAGGLVLLPLNASATVRVRYYARPGKLCLETDPALCKPITAVTPGPITTTIVTGGFALTKVDIVAGGPAHQIKAVYASLAGGVTLQTADLLEAINDPSTNGVFDYVTVPDRSPVVALPEELSSTLALRTAAKVLANLGYKDEAAVQYGFAETAQGEAFALLRPRSDGNPKRLGGGVLARMGGSMGPWGNWGGG